MHPFKGASWNIYTFVSILRNEEITKRLKKDIF